MLSQAVLEIQNLSLEFPVFGGSVKALNSVNLRVMPGEIVGVVGESGSGKSVTAMTAMRLLPKSSYQITGGSVHILGEDMLAATESNLRSWRGQRVSMIFQEPMTALNPTMRIGKQLSNILRLHRGFNASQAFAESVKILQEMMISDPEQVLHAYPFELSGGMRQRIMVAMAFSCNPELLIADEPTTALDVTVQRQVLQLLKQKANERGTAILFITHDMAVVSQFCDRVYVMYAGTVVEQGPTKQILQQPFHPYTKGLLDGLPELAEPGTPLSAIAGQVPDMRVKPKGCVFYDRCAFADERCLIRPLLEPTDDNRSVACWHPLKY